MPEGLKLIVTSDVTQAEAGLKKFVATAGKEGEAAAASLSTGLNKVNPAATKTFSNLSTQAKIAIKPISALGESIETLRAKLLARQNFLITETDITKIAVYNKEIKDLEGEIFRLSNVGKEGFDAVGNSIVRATSGVDNFASGAGKAFSVLRQVAFILPGIGIAGLLGGLSELVIGLFKAKQGFSDAEFEAERFNASIVRLKDDLTGLKFALDFNIDLNKLRAQLAGKTPGAVDILGLGETIKGNRLLQNQITDQLDSLNDTIRKKTNFANQVLSAQGKQLLETIRGDVNAILPQSLVDKLSSGDRKVLNEIAGFNEKRKILLDQQSKLSEESAKALIEIEIKKNEEQAKILKKQQKAVFEPTFELQKRGLEVREQLANEIIKEFDKSKSPIKLPKLLSPFQITDFDINLDPTGTNFSVENRKKVSEDLQRAISNKPLIVAIPISPEIILKAEQFQATLKAINSTISRAAEDSLAGIGDTLGTALVGGDLQKSLQGFVSIIGSAVQAIGKEFIHLGIVALFAKQAIKSVFTNPAVAIAAGIALVAAGAALKQSLSKGVTGFAEGGLVFGPTMGLVGEGRGTSRSNPEVIAPLDKLQAMLGGLGNNRSQKLYATIRGNDILLSNERTGKYNRR